MSYKPFYIETREGIRPADLTNPIDVIAVREYLHRKAKWKKKTKKLKRSRLKRQLTSAGGNQRRGRRTTKDSRNVGR